MLDRKEKKHGESILNLLQDLSRKGDVLSFLAPSLREAQSCVSDCGKVNNIKDISGKIEKSKQVGIKSNSHAFFLDYTGSTLVHIMSSKMKHSSLMRNIIFLDYKRKTKMIKPVDITRAHFSLSLPYMQYFALVYLSSPLVSFEGKEVYD